MNPLFIKLMLMTTSPHDGEALTAIRKANAILAAANVNWAEFLSAVDTNKDQTYRTPPSQRQQRRQPPEPNPKPKPKAAAADNNAFTDMGSQGSTWRYDDAAEIETMFEQALERSEGSFTGFLDSVYRWWEEKGFLTEKQYFAIKRAAEGH